MKREFLFGAIMAGAALAGTATGAQAAPLDVKTGLWEMTLHTQSHGRLPVPPEVLRQMSPERRAALEKKIKERNEQPRSLVYKQCITPQKLQKDEAVFISGEPGMKCGNKFSRRTRTAVAGTSHCTRGRTQRTSDFAFEVPDREHVTGTINASVSDGTSTMTSRGRLSGRWLRAFCGGRQ
jgi:uncharacterized cupin superfamily protein